MSDNKDECLKSKPAITYEEYAKALKTVLEYKDQVENHHRYLVSNLTPEVYVNGETKIGDIHDHISTRIFGKLAALTNVGEVFSEYRTSEIKIKDLAAVGFVKLRSKRGFGIKSLRVLGGLCYDAGLGEKFYRGSNY